MTKFLVEIYNENTAREQQGGFRSRRDAWVFIQGYSMLRWPNDETFSDNCLETCVTNKYREIQLQDGFFASVDPEVGRESVSVPTHTIDFVTWVDTFVEDKTVFEESPFFVCATRDFDDIRDASRSVKYAFSATVTSFLGCALKFIIDVASSPTTEEVLDFIVAISVFLTTVWSMAYGAKAEGDSTND